MSQEQALDDTGSAAQQNQHSDDISPKSSPVQYGNSRAQQTLGVPARKNMDFNDEDGNSEDSSVTPVTVKAISPAPKDSPSRLDSDNNLQIPSGGKTEKSVRSGQPQLSSTQVSIQQLFH